MSTKEEIKNEPIKIAADIYWCQHAKVNPMSGKFQVSLCNLSENAVKELAKLGVKARSDKQNKPDQGNFITCKSNRPILVFDESGNQITQEIGNKSKAKALVGSYSWTHQSKTGISPSLKKLIITNLIAYDNAVDISLDDDSVF